MLLLERDLNPANEALLRRLLDVLRASLMGLPDYTECDDGSLLVELLAPRCRLGFSFEPDPVESGWYYVDLGPPVVTESGTQAGADIVALVMRYRQASGR